MAPWSAPPPALWSAPPPLCRHASCSGGAPWCSATPSPTPGLQRSPLRGPRPQQRTDLRGEPWPHGVGRPASSRTTPPHLSRRLASPWLRVTLPRPPRSPLSPPSPPFLLAKGLAGHPPIPGDRPGVALLSCPQHPLLSSSCDWGGGGIWDETNRKQKPNPIYAISVCPCRPRPATAGSAGGPRAPGRPLDAGRRPPTGGSLLPQLSCP